MSEWTLVDIRCGLFKCEKGHLALGPSGLISGKTAMVCPVCAKIKAAREEVLKLACRQVSLHYFSLSKVQIKDIQHNIRQAYKGRFNEQG